MNDVRPSAPSVAVFSRWAFPWVFLALVLCLTSPVDAQVPAPASSGGFDLRTLITPGGMTSNDDAARAAAEAPSLDRSRAAVAVAEAAADQAMLGFLPRIDLSARYTRINDIEQGGIGGGISPEQEALARGLIAGVEDPEAQALFTANLESQLALGNFSFPILLNQYAFRASLTYPVSDLFLRVLPTSEASESFAEAERVRLEAQRLDVELQAREAFYQTARARGALAVAQASLAQAEAQRRQVEALVNAGSAARVDLMRIEAQVASARVGVAQANNGVRLAEFSLRTLIRAPDEPITIGEDLLTALPAAEGDKEALVARALQERSEVRAIEQLIEGNESLVTAREGGRYPRLSLQGNVDIANPNNRVFPQTEEFRTTWDISAVLSWSPNDYLSANEDVLQAEGQLAQVRADSEALEDAVRLEVTNAFEGYDSATVALEAATAGIQAAEEAYRVRQQQLAAGAAATNEVIDAEADLTRARLQFLDALIDQRIARARLDRAVGP